MRLKRLTCFQPSFLLVVFLSATSVGKRRGEQGINGTERKNEGVTDCSLSVSGEELGASNETIRPQKDVLLV